MAKEILKNISSSCLVDRYADISLKMYEALGCDETAEYKRLFLGLRAVEDELRSRAGDERRLLCVLHVHPNAQVRLNSARATLAIAPDASRAALEALHQSQDFPWAGHAGMTLSNLDEGVFNPA